MDEQTANTVEQAERVVASLEQKRFADRSVEGLQLTRHRRIVGVEPIKPLAGFLVVVDVRPIAENGTLVSNVSAALQFRSWPLTGRPNPTRWTAF